MSQRRHEWTDPETGVVFWLNEDGTIRYWTPDAGHPGQGGFTNALSRYATHLVAALESRDAEIERLREVLAWAVDELSAWWRFDEAQQPMSSWHEREGFLKELSRRAALSHTPEEDE